MFGPRRSIVSPRAAKGKRVYAVGDVHGRIDLLEAIILAVCRHRKRQLFDDTMFCFLGDVIDRGPQSARCLAAVRTLCAEGVALCLRGNHEDMMLHAIDGDSAAQDAWLTLGGAATLASYGIKLKDNGEDAFDFGERLTAELPDADIAFLRQLPLSHRSGDYLFVHAGVRPGVPLHRQKDGDLYTIRDPFLTSSAWHGAVIVHGHTVVDTVEIRQNRIAIDTGAWKSGLLSAVCVEDDWCAVLSVTDANP